MQHPYMDIITTIAALVAAYFAWRSYQQQARRWKEEDDKKLPKARVLADNRREDGWIHGVCHVDNPSGVDLRFAGVQVVSPRGARIARQRQSQQGGQGEIDSEPLRKLDIDLRIPGTRRIKEENCAGRDIFVRLPEGLERSEVTLRFDLAEFENPRRRRILDAKAMFPREE